MSNIIKTVRQQLSLMCITGLILIISLYVNFYIIAVILVMVLCAQWYQMW